MEALLASWDQLELGPEFSHFLFMRQIERDLQFSMIFKNHISTCIRITESSGRMLQAVSSHVRPQTTLRCLKWFLSGARCPTLMKMAMRKIYMKVPNQSV